ncbi:MAG: NAD(P)/FAD-dependent oxidoreductase [Crocosphaera sp.]|nr:NAD(P)/FAD-dependent oxidoreductase [Crocosphaera sp.]
MSSTEIIIIGSGIGGLSCGALLAHYGLEVTVCESHSIPGGAAHSFQRDGFIFDSGPSLYSGLSYSPSPNPLKQVLDAIGEPLPCLNYDTWGCYLPEGNFHTSVGAEQFGDILQQIRGKDAVQEWRKLQQVMKPLAEASIALPPAAIRFDWNAVVTVSKFAPELLRKSSQVLKLIGPFSHIADEVISDPFIHHWLDLLCFLLSGLPATGTSAAEMAFMFADWYRPGVVLDYPVGGSGALVDALVRGLTKNGGKLQLNAHVKQILVKNNRAMGVQLRNGDSLRASGAVISNASVWDTLKLLPLDSVSQQWRRQKQQTPPCGSFLHLHLGIDGKNLPSDLPCHHIVVNDWEKGIQSPQNVVLVSIPSLLDPSLAPPGKQTIHVYTPGNEPYHLWSQIKGNSEAYQQQKEQRSQVMWQALERIIPDIRERISVALVGTPLTHERFLRRYQGTYGPAIEAGKAFFPGPNTPIQGLWCCGDSTFPGIGLPAVAASGMMLANTIASVEQHLHLLKRLS